MKSKTLNEEELRSKVIIPLLKDIGFSYDDIQLETTFSIQLGRGVYDIKNDKRAYIGGRLDILCKIDGKNLFIIELKAEDVEINLDKDSMQGLSYARLLNPMAPFVLVTNCKESYLFDTITGLETTNDLISSNKFSPALDSEINLRYEALKSFIGYSQQNLKIFCDAFNNKYLENFRSNTNDSAVTALEKKYIPEIYIARSNAVSLFKLFLEDSNTFIFPIIGESGVGKTNTIINIYENFTEYPSIFYSGTLLENSFFEELKFDFNLEFSTLETELSLLKKIASLSESNHKPFIIFIDAIDEWIASNAVKQLNDLTKILARYKIKLCISCKDIVWNNFLIQRGIPTHFSKYLYSEVKLSNFNESELKIVLKNYVKKLNIKIKDESHLTDLNNPFNLRIACEVSFIKNIELDLSHDSRDTLKIFISQKIQKTHNPTTNERFLNSICKILLENNVIQVNENIIRKELGMSLLEEFPFELFSSNFLYRNFLSNSSDIYIGFYFSKVRDHIISVSVLNLANSNSDERINTVMNSVSSYVGENAVNYFFKTGNKQEQQDCAVALINFDKKYSKSILFKILAQQQLALLQNLIENNLQIILDHVLYIIQNIKNDFVIDREITSFLQNISLKSNIEPFLINLLTVLDKYNSKGYDISPVICQMLQNYGDSANTNRLIEILLDKNFDPRIRRFVIDSLDYRTFENRETIFLTLLDEEINTSYEGVVFYAKHWYNWIETADLRNKLIQYFDDSANDSIKNLLIHILMGSELQDTGEILFDRFLSNKYSEQVTSWVCRAICSNNYRKAIPKFIELLKSDPTNELSGHILIGLGEMGAREAIPALIDIIINLDEKVDLTWLSMAFDNIADDSDYEKLVDIHKSTSNQNTRFLIALILAKRKNKIYHQIIIDSFRDTTIPIPNRKKILSEWANKLCTTKVESHYEINNITNLEANGILTEDEIISIYEVVEANNELSILALSILMNFDIKFERLGSKIINILPNINYKLNTRQFFLINSELMKYLQNILNPWLEKELLKQQFTNINFIHNCLQFSGILGDKRVLESIHANREWIIKHHKYSEKYLNYIEHIIRTSGDEIRLRLDY